MPSILSLPNEILLEIAHIVTGYDREHAPLYYSFGDELPIDYKSLCSLVLTCHHFHSLMTPVLYCTIGAKDLGRLFHTLCTRKELSGMVQEMHMEHHGWWELTAEKIHSLYSQPTVKLFQSLGEDYGIMDLDGSDMLRQILLSTCEYTRSLEFITLLHCNNIRRLRIAYTESYFGPFKMSGQKVACVCRVFRKLEEIFIYFHPPATSAKLYLNIIRDAPQLRKCILYSLPTLRMTHGLGSTSITELILGHCVLPYSLLENILSHLPNLLKFVYWQDAQPTKPGELCLPEALMATIEKHTPNVEFLGISWRREDIITLKKHQRENKDLAYIQTLRGLRRLETLILHEDGHRLCPSATAKEWSNFLPPSIRVLALINPSGQWNLRPLKHAKANRLPHLTSVVYLSAKEAQQQDSIRRFLRQNNIEIKFFDTTNCFYHEIYLHL